MKISLIQFDIAWQNPEENIRRMDALLAKAPASDIYLLPETCSTGFCMEPESCAEEERGVTREWMRKQAAARDGAICGSVMTRTAAGFVNRLYFARPDGEVLQYDKRHLFSFSGENIAFTAGHERPIWEFRGVKIMPVVCYDLRFPVWMRNCDEYDVALVVACWPASRQLAWETLLRARAMENQCYVAGVNRVGVDPFGNYEGGSMVVNPYGLSAVECERGVPDVATVEMDMEKMGAFREKFPSLKDRDNFTIHY